MLSLGRLAARRALSLVSAARMIPHPEKAHRGGEDAFFIASDGLAVGVADGVGGWADVPGADPARYSRDLMRFSCELSGLADPRAILDGARARLDLSIPGSTTALVAKLYGGALHVCNVGDSALAVFRGGRRVFRTRDTLLGFNFPLQIGSRGGVGAADGTCDRVGLAPGDVLVLATDGLWDNVWERDVERIVAAAGRAKGEAAVEGLAAALAETAAANGGNAQFLSPFAAAVRELGHAYTGGKLDDVTVVACVVVAGDNDAAAEAGPHERREAGSHAFL